MRTVYTEILSLGLVLEYAKKYAVYAAAHFEASPWRVREREASYRILGGEAGWTVSCIPCTGREVLGPELPLPPRGYHYRCTHLGHQGYASVFAVSLHKGYQPVSRDMRYGWTY